MPYKVASQASEQKYSRLSKKSHIEFCLIFCSRFIFVKDALNTNFFPNLKIKKFTSQNILCRSNTFQLQDF